MHDTKAADRLLAEVRRLYEDQTQQRFTWTGLEAKTKVRRQTLVANLETGVMPTPANVAKIAEAFDVEPNRLWARWLGLSVGSLDRIAEELAGIRLALSGEVSLDDVADSAAVAGRHRADTDLNGATPDTRPRKPRRRARGDGTAPAR